MSQILVDLKPVVDLNTVDLNTIVAIHCPNCGSHAERHNLVEEQLTRIQCAACDYLMITCARTGKVIEAYAPGIYARCKLPS